MCISENIGNFFVFSFYSLICVTFELELWGSVVVFLAQKGCILESLVDHSLMQLKTNKGQNHPLNLARKSFKVWQTVKNLQLAFWVNHTNPLGLQVSTRRKEQDVLVDEHPQGDEGHVEPVQEVLNRDIHVLLDTLLVVELKDALDKR